MARTNNDLIAGLIGQFQQNIALRKTAQEAPSLPPQGQTAVAVDAVSGQKDRGAEMQKDVEDTKVGDATLAVSSEAQVKDGDTAPLPPGQIEMLDASQAAPEGGQNPTVTEITTGASPASDLAKVARAERLGASILQFISNMQGAQAQPSLEKTASQQIAAADPAVVQAFLEFNAGFQRGIEKKAQDMQEVIDAGVAPTPEDASALLDAVATEDPEAVLPEEAQPEAAVDPEQVQMITELADAMTAEGVGVEELVQAAQTVQELQDAGVSPEEIIQAAGEVGQEDQAAAEEKIAAERKALAKDKLTQILRRK
jgi:hypothetical protein